MKTCTKEDFKKLEAEEIYQGTFKGDPDKTLICIDFEEMPVFNSTEMENIYSNLRFEFRQCNGETFKGD